jgi:D-sedoheptulose 7-phosphate isomerase
MVPQGVLSELFVRYPQLLSCKQQTEAALKALISGFGSGNKLLLCGNGGSAADADHIAGELLKGFMSKRPMPREDIDRIARVSPQEALALGSQLQQGLPAISLCAHQALNTAFLNDVNPQLAFAQQVYAYGKPDDMLLCISTSGNAKNVIAAATVGRAFGLTVIGLTGASGGALKQWCDIAICVPEEQTFKIQELHLPVYHALCAGVEKAMFG